MLLAEPGAACFPYRPVLEEFLRGCGAPPRFPLRVGRRDTTRRNEILINIRWPERLRLGRHCGARVRGRET